MRQPPRQPPRQQPKPAARRQPQRPAKGAAPKGGAKGQPRQQRGQGGSARATQHARDAQRQAQRGRQQQTARGRGRQQAKTRVPQQGRPLRGWRSWWATHEMDQRSRPQRGGRGGVGGGFANLNSFGGTRAAGVLTLLLLTLFTGAIALGAQSIPAAVIAFLFLAGAIAMVTAARARHHFIHEPAETEVPLEKVAEFHIDDLTTEDEPAETEVNSLDDLERSFTHETVADDKPEPAAEPPKPPAKAAEVATPAKDTITVTVGEPAEPVDAADAPEPAEPAAEPTDRPTEPPPTPEPESTTDLDKDTTPDDPDADEDDDTDDLDLDEDDADEDEDEDQPKVTEVPAPRQPADADEPEAEPVEADYDDIDALMAPLLDEDDETENADPQPSKHTDSTGTALSLLAAETPGTAPQYAGVSTLPPEAVRDVAATLIVTDLSRSIMFYTELLGLVEIDRAPDAVLLEAGFGRVLLWRRDDAPGAGDPVMHLTFEVGDIDTAYETMRAKGIEFIHPPRAALSGEVHDLRAASFLDPDGHGLAITELREHASRRLTTADA